MPITINGNGLISGLADIEVADGTASSPTLSNIDDANTGIFFPAEDTVAISTGSSERMRIDNAGQVTVGLGSAAAPVLSFSGDTNTGVYSPAADNVSLSTGGTERLRVDSSGNTFGVAAQNLLYNGAMQVAQRSTSVAGITTVGYYTADRWKLIDQDIGTWTQSIENDAPTGSGLRKSLKMLCTTAKASPAAGDLQTFGQLLEGQDLQLIRKGTSSAQQVTLSFWVKSNVTGTYIAMLYDADNGRSVCASYSISASATWERKTITFPADTTGAFDNDNAASLWLIMHMGVGSSYTSGALNTSWNTYVNLSTRAAGQVNVAAATNNYWQITGVQLEVGPIASPFQFKPYQQELRECQRYFLRYLTGFPAFVELATQVIGPLSFCTTMRATPSLALSGNPAFFEAVSNGTFTGTITAGFTGKVDGANYLRLSGYAGLTVGRTGIVLNDGSELRFSAEL